MFVTAGVWKPSQEETPAAEVSPAFRCETWPWIFSPGLTTRSVASS
jgi:hypothetical protein